MCSNDSPSEKDDGTTEVQPLLDSYDTHLETLRLLPLPQYRTRELHAATEAVRDRLATSGFVPPSQLQHLLCVVAEAIDDVRAAAMGEPDRLPEAPRHPVGTPRDEYAMTPEERETALDGLTSLQFTLVETPTLPDGWRERLAGHDADAAPS
ncbi:hypothetical protein RYH80_12115 [Halobaculum sp. MBLA0147]|uniref:hypothetical protein n=1 Tax=Halobaculum sp. MBLA0147 TaxID=3079934 RepID=UPI0035264D9C